MSCDACCYEYELNDIEGFATHGLSDLRARGLWFSRYGDKFFGSRSKTDLAENLSVAQVQAAIQAETLTPYRAIRTYVVTKRRAGQPRGSAQMRVFSDDSAMEQYLRGVEAPADPTKTCDGPSDGIQIASAANLSAESDIYTNMDTCILDSMANHEPCDCDEQAMQEDALEAIEPAVPGPEASGCVDARAARVRPLGDALVLELADGRRLQMPRSWFAFLDPADEAQWQGIELDGTRTYLKWPRLRRRVAIWRLLDPS
jgi:hypothetical protein